MSLDRMQWLSFGGQSVELQCSMVQSKSAPTDTTIKSTIWEGLPAWEQGMDYPPMAPVSVLGSQTGSPIATSTGPSHSLGPLKGVPSPLSSRMPVAQEDPQKATDLNLNTTAVPPQPLEVAVNSMYSKLIGAPEATEMPRKPRTVLKNLALVQSMTASALGPTLTSTISLTALPMAVATFAGVEEVPTSQTAAALASMTPSVFLTSQVGTAKVDQQVSSSGDTGQSAGAMASVTATLSEHEPVATGLLETPSPTATLVWSFGKGSGNNAAAIAPTKAALAPEQSMDQVQVEAASVATATAASQAGDSEATNQDGAARIARARSTIPTVTEKAVFAITAAPTLRPSTATLKSVESPRIFADYPNYAQMKGAAHHTSGKAQSKDAAQTTSAGLAALVPIAKNQDGLARLSELEKDAGSRAKTVTYGHHSSRAKKSAVPLGLVDGMLLGAIITCLLGVLTG